MDALHDLLRRHLPRTLGTVVHVGAGAQALDLYADFDIDRLVLVEGDPDTCAELESLARRSGRAVEVREAVVMPQSGPVLWHRYSVRALNGPMPADGLVDLYPRLRQWSTLPRQGTGVAELLDSLGLQRSDARPAVLLIDTPSQAVDLARCLDAQSLHAFDWILLTAMGAGLCPPGLAPAAAAAEILEAASFAAVHPDDGEQAGAFALQVWRFDRHRHELQQLQTLVRLAHADLAGTRADLTSARTELAATQSDLATARAGRQSLEAELQALGDRLTQASAEHEAAIGKLQGQARSAREDVDDLTRQRDDAVTQRDTAAAEAAAQASRNGQLQADLQRVGDELRAASERLRTQETELQALRGELTKSLAAHDTALAALRSDAEAATHAADRRAQESKQQCEQALRERDAIAAERKALQARHEQLQAQLQAAAAEAQAAEETARQTIEALTQERDQQAQWHQENAKWARKLDAQCKQLQQELDAANAALSAAQAERVQASTELQAREEELVRAQDALTQTRAEADRAVAQAREQSDIAVARAREESSASLAAMREEQTTARTAAEEAAAAQRAALELQITQLRDDAAAAAQTHHALRAECDALRASVEQLEAQAKEAAAALQQERTTRTEIENKCNWRGDQMNLFKRERDELQQQAQAAAQEREKLLGQVAKLQEAMATARGDAETAQAAAQDRDKLAGQVAKLQQEIAAARSDAETARAAGKQAEQSSRQRMAELEDEIGQLRLRQRLLDEEMIRAEGQIELIKDVLLREPSL